MARLAPASQLPEWPPSLSESSSEELVATARDWAMSHSLVYRPPIPSSTANVSDAIPFNTSVTHAPFALFPSPFPRCLFEQATSIQKAYNALYSRLSCDYETLERVIGGNVSRVDEFQGELWRIAQRVRHEGVAQNVHLGLYRSDYLLHQSDDDTHELSIQQVEFNTISSSFGALSTKVTQLHRFLAQTGAYPGTSNPPIHQDSLPGNVALKELSRGLALAHQAYIKERDSHSQIKPTILFVVQDPERNAFDQRALEYELLEEHDIDVVRLSFAQLYDRASLSPSRQLLISPSSSNASDEMSDKKLIEISVVYFRAGYAPTDYTDLSCWDTRLLLERSAAIKCPSVQLQLAGAKKVQQVLASSRGALERYANTQHRENELSQRDLQGLRETFTGLYPLDDTPEGQQAEKMARDQPERFVLKPQREGGGNNIYRHDIPPFLTALEAEDTKRAKTSSVGFPKAKEGYILMDIISPPQGLQNLLVRASDMKPKLGQVVSELGIYGVCLFRDTGEGGADSAELLENYPAGHLLRTKGRESDEGGVAVGFSVIDSPLLV